MTSFRLTDGGNPRKIWPLFVLAGLSAALGAAVWFTAFVAWPVASFLVIIGSAEMISRARRRRSETGP